MKLLADWVGKRARERFTDDKDLLVVGDFNIPSTTGPMWKAITAKGLRMPAALAGVHGSDLRRGSATTRSCTCR